MLGCDHTAVPFSPQRSWLSPCNFSNSVEAEEQRKKKEAEETEKAKREERKQRLKEAREKRQAERQAPASTPSAPEPANRCDNAKGTPLFSCSDLVSHSGFFVGMSFSISTPALTKSKRVQSASGDWPKLGAFGRTKPRSM